MDEYNDFKAGDGTNGNSFEDSPRARIEINPEGGPLSYSLPSLHYRYAEHISKRGFSNGLLRIPKETFEKYIEAYEENKRLGVVISHMEREAGQKAEKIRTTESERDQYLAGIIRKKQESAHQKEEKTRFAAPVQKASERLEFIRQQFERNTPAYGWIGTVLFLFAGFLFIKTDISIINTIAFNGLDMTAKEAMSFALGFAFLAIVLKPLVDRFFEQPYQSGRKGRMHGLLIFIGLCTVIALGFMGAYRSQAFVSATKKGVIEAELNRLYDEQNRGLRPGADPEIIKWEQEQADLAEGADNWLVKGIFISSSILFAIAGAICFSIGVPAFRRHANRVSGKMICYFRIAYYLRLQKKADRLSRFAENEWKISEQRLALLPDLTILQAEWQRLNNELQLARAVQHQAHTEAVLAIYRDNYERGKRYIPSEEELAQFEILLSEQNEVKQRNFQLNRKFSGSNLFNSQYLHEYIRQKIHNDNEQKVKQNGYLHHPNGVK